MKLSVHNMQGSAVGTLEVSDYLFDVPMNSSVVHQAMVMHRANARQGTSGTKTRAQVSGGGAKPRPQKHTGRARQGTIRAPQFRGGGVVFGPHPRSYRQRMPKKMRRLAIRCLLSEKVRENSLAVLQELQMPQAKTQEMKRLLDTLEISSSVLIVTHEAENSVVASAQNLQQVKTMPASNLNVLDLLSYDRLIMTMEAIHKAESVWDGGATPQEMVPTPTATSGRRRRSTARATATKKTTREAPPAEDQPRTGPPDDEVSQEVKG